MTHPDDKRLHDGQRQARAGDLPRHNDPTKLEPRPVAPPPPGLHDNVVQLRRDIDSGATKDKVAALDPAAAPLGTDDEAGGATLPPGLVGNIRSIERAPVRMRAREDQRARWLAGGLVVAVLLAAVALWLSFTGVGTGVGTGTGTGTGGG